MKNSHGVLLHRLLCTYLSQRPWFPSPYFALFIFPVYSAWMITYTHGFNIPKFVTLNPHSNYPLEQYYQMNQRYRSHVGYVSCLFTSDSSLMWSPLSTFPNVKSEKVKSCPEGFRRRYPNWPNRPELSLRGRRKDKFVNVINILITIIIRKTFPFFYYLWIYS